jgi:hypothetical protein
MTPHDFVLQALIFSRILILNQTLNIYYCLQYYFKSIMSDDEKISSIHIDHANVQQSQMRNTFLSN